MNSARSTSGVKFVPQMSYRPKEAFKLYQEKKSIDFVSAKTVDTEDVIILKKWVRHFRRSNVPCFTEIRGGWLILWKEWRA